MYLNDGDFKSANDYCERVLDIDPENARAYLGKLMAELKCRREDELKNQPQPFDDKANYKKALSFGDEALKKKLKADIDFIKQRSLQKAYDWALSMMNNASGQRDYQAAADAFKKLSGFKDADERAAACLRCIEGKQAEAKKRSKITAMAAAAAAVCVVAVLLVIKVIIPNGNYNKAVALYEAKEYDAAIEAFEALNGYKDSAEQIRLCKIGIKDRAYDEAVALREAGEYGKAILALKALDGYKGSTSLIFDIVNDAPENAVYIANVGDEVKFGEYEQNNNTSNGKEKLEWKVLDKIDGKLLMISKYGLAPMPYNEKYESTTWEKCTLRTWLNNDFINAAFSDTERGMIATSVVTADNNPQYSTNSGKDTEDKVFLLSISEAEKYFSTYSGRQAAATEYAIAQGASTSDSYKTSNGLFACAWWLRSPGIRGDGAAGVYHDGSVLYRGVNVNDVYATVRPAMWISLE